MERRRTSSSSYSRVAAAVETSENFLRSVSVPLQGRLSLVTVGKPIPELRLQLELHGSSRSQREHDAVLTSALVAFLQLAQFIRQQQQQQKNLDAELNTRLWMSMQQILQMNDDSHAHYNSAWTDGADLSIDYRVMELTGAPQFGIDVIIAQRERGEAAMNGGSMDALVAILQSRGALLASLQKERVEAQPIIKFLPACVDLRFTECSVTAKSLQLLQKSLDQVAACGSPCFKVKVLSLNGHRLTGEQLTMLTVIMRKNNQEYGIQELELDSTFEHAAASTAYKVLLATIFQPPSCLRRVSLAHNWLHPCHFAVICSALRYGCTIEELVLAETMSILTPTERQECWCWLTFGLFYPRSTSVTSFHQAPRKHKLRKIDLTGLIHDLEDTTAITRTLCNPGVLVHHDVQDLMLMYGKLKICTLKPGATTYKHADATSLIVMTLDGDSGDDGGDLEYVFEAPAEKNGWTCIVVPGYGLGWVVTSSQVLDTELARATVGDNLPPLYDVTVCVDSGATRSVLPARSLELFIRNVGRQLSGLHIGGLDFNEPAYASAFTAIGSHCRNLRKLVLHWCDLDAQSTQELFRALGGDLGPSLVTLNFNKCAFTTPDRDAVDQIWALLLGDERRCPKLKRLYLNLDDEWTWAQVKKMYEVLPQRKQLEVLELQIPRIFHIQPPREVTHPRTRFRFITPKMLDDKCHNEFLSSTLGSKRKTAFLSVLQQNQMTTQFQSSSRGHRTQALAHFDVVIVRMIFEFATVEVHRKLLWAHSPSHTNSWLW